MISRRPSAILMYHRVEDATYDPWRLSVRPANFEQHLRALSRHRVVPLSQLMETAGAIAITFDDGYLDFLENALPLLEKYNMPATLFYPIDAMHGREFWWDRVEHFLEGQRGEPSYVGLALLERRRIAALGAKLRSLAPSELEQVASQLGVRHSESGACARHQMLTRDQLRVVARSPLIEIGAHTLSHPCLPQLSQEEQVREINESRCILEDIVGKPIKSFAYPYGAHDDRSVHAAKYSGIDIACIVGGGLVRESTHPLRLPRLMVRDFSGAGFLIHLKLWMALRWFA